MISISTPTFDLSGNIILQESATSNMHSATRRVSRTATLDIDVAIADMGYTHGDRTFLIVVDGATKQQINQISYLQENYPSLLLSNDEGIFLGTLSSRALRAGKLNITFLVKQKLTEG